MKNSTIICVIAIVLALTGENSIAQENKMPILNTAVQTGNTLLFDAMDGSYVFIPTFFTSKFSCGSNTSQSYCTLRIFNDLNEQTSSQIEKSVGTKDSVVDLRADIYDMIVGNVNESFEGGLSTSLQDSGGALFLKTLALLGNVPYVNASFRTNHQTSDSLLSNYSSIGIGTYQAKFDLRGVKAFESLSIVNNDAIKNSLRSLLNHEINYPQLKIWVHDQIMPYVKAKNISPDESLTLVSRFLKSKLFTWTPNAELMMNDDKLALFLGQKQSKISIISELSEIVTVKCAAVLPLKDQSISQLECDGGLL